MNTIIGAALRAAADERERDCGKHCGPERDEINKLACRYFQTSACTIASAATSLSTGASAMRVGDDTVSETELGITTATGAGSAGGGSNCGATVNVGVAVGVGVGGVLAGRLSARPSTSHGIRSDSAAVARRS